MFREQVVRYCVDTTTAKTSSTNMSYLQSYQVLILLKVTYHWW